MSVYSLIYCSAACQTLSAELLQAVLHRSRAYNAARRITGLLLCTDQQFLQLIEGQRHEVLYLFRRIARDPRHTQVRLLHQGPQPQRLCPDWQMGYALINSPEYHWLSTCLDAQWRASIVPPHYNTDQLAAEVFTDFVAGRAVSY